MTRVKVAPARELSRREPARHLTHALLA